MKHSSANKIVVLSILLALAFSAVGSALVHAAGILYAKPTISGIGNCSSWANACTLQTALTNAVSGDEIWVMEGVHKPTTDGNRAVSFQLVSGVAVYGGFSGDETARSQRHSDKYDDTILSGDLAGNDNNNIVYYEPTRSENSGHVVVGATNARLDGVVITGGNANAYGSDGGGMYNVNADPVLANVIIRNNTSNNHGGGMYGKDSSPTLTNVIVSENSAGSPEWSEGADGYGGGMSFLNGSPILTDVAISGNSAFRWMFGEPRGYVGGLYCGNCTLTMTNVTVSDNYGDRGINVGAGSILTNVTVSNNYYGISVGSNATLNNVTISNNAVIGLEIFGSPTLTNVTISGTKKVPVGFGNLGWGFGINVNTDSDPILNHVTVAGNEGIGMFVKDSSSDPQVRNSIFWGNESNDDGEQITTEWFSHTTVTDSVLQGGCSGWDLTLSCTNVITSDPKLGPLGNYGGYTQTIPLRGGSSAIDATSNNCISTDQRGQPRSSPNCDIGAYEYNPGIYYVKPSVSGTGDCSSWANACALQTALILAGSGSEVWVAAGAYKPTIGTDRDATFQLGAGAAVYGGFAGTETLRNQRDPAAHPTILSGDIDNNDVNTDGIVETAADIKGSNSYHVVIGASGATLDGFTVTAGDADGADCPGTGCGGGMLNSNTFPTVANVTFSGNAATSGGGMYNWTGAASSGPTIMNVTFSGNSATGNGGGMYNELSRPKITNVTFSGNSAGGSGGGMFNHTQLSGADTPMHVTFSGNAAASGGGVYNYYGSVIYRNTIFWGNTAASGAQAFEEGSALTIYDSVVQDGCPVNVDCAGIITGDPLLGSLGNYGGWTPTILLQGGSSAVDMANDTYCPSTDQRGVGRPQGPHCDIGAYEVDNTAPSLTSFTRQNPLTSPTNADALVFRATFNENVHNVDVADFTISGTTATIALVTVVNDSVYDITVSGGDLSDLNGIVGLDLAAGQNIVDITGYALPPGEPAIDETYEVSNAELYLVSFTRQNPPTSPTNADTLVFRATFSAAAQYLHPTAFSATGTTASVTLITQINASTYDITVAGGDLAGLNGTVGLDLSPWSEISDLDENPMPLVEPAVDEVYEVDNTVPSLISFTRQNPTSSPTNANALIFRATFDEDVQNVDTGDFAVNGTTTATVMLVTPVSAGVYDVTVSGGNLDSFNGIVGLDLAASQNITDLGGNFLPAGEPATDETYLMDNTAPIVTTFLATTPTNNLNISITSFTATDSVGVTGYLVTQSSTAPLDSDPGWTGTAPTVYTVGSEGTYVLYPWARDGVGNVSLTFAAPLTIVVDTTPPTITINDPDTLPAQSKTITASASDGTLSMSNTSGATCDGSLTFVVYASQTFTSESDNGTRVCYRAVDVAGNTAYSLSNAIGGIDTTAPSLLSFTRLDPATNPTNAASLTFRATFSKDIQNVNASDFTVNGTTTATITLVTPVSASVYDITVSGGDLASYNGTVNLSLSAGQNITDLAGNALPTGTPAVNEIYTVDHVAPTVAITSVAPNPTNTSPISIIITFNESVTGFAVSNITVANGTIGNFTGSGAVYTADIIPVADGLVTVDIVADVAMDAANNGNLAMSQFSHIYDTTYPFVVYALNTVPYNNSVLLIGPTRISIEFNEDVIHDGSDDAANSLINYLLVADGPDAVFNTVSCATGLIADDIYFRVDSATYTNNGGEGPFLATLNINGGTPLPHDIYRLYICGTRSIHDPADNILNGGFDSQLNFSVQVGAFPATGFAPDRITILPQQTVSYADLGDLWLEIPKLNVKIPIVGVPLSGDEWNITWLGNNAGYLEGTAYPTWPGNTVLTAHVWDAYNNPGPFAKIKNLRYGDKFIIHIGGMDYVYEVRQNLLISPQNIDKVLVHEEYDWVTLITCEDYDTDRNTYSYRRMVRAVLVAVK